MKEKLVTLGTFACLFVLTCLLLVHALAIFPGVPAIRWFMGQCATVIGRLDAPAWVQAVGSVLAIGVAIAIPVQQQRRQKKDEVRRHWTTQLAIARSCYLTCDEAAQTMGYIATKLRSNVGNDFRLRSERVSDLLATLQTLVSKDIPPELLKDLLAIQRELSYTQMALAQLWEVKVVSAKRADAAEAREKRVDAALNSLKHRHQLYEWIHSQRGPRVFATPLDLSDMLE